MHHYTGICENDSGLNWHICTKRLDISVVMIKKDILEAIYASIINQEKHQSYSI